MKHKISDEDVFQLLGALKNSDSDYPQDMIASRRDMFTKQAAAMAAMMKAGINGANSSGTGSTASTSTSASVGSSATTTGLGGPLGGILETLLTIAIIAEVSVAAYVYRENIADFINSAIGTKVERVSTPSDNSPGAISTSNGTAFITEIPTDTPTATDTTTPTPTVTITIISSSTNNSGDSGSGNPGNTNADSTPTPNDGNHYGNTPKPERTKDNTSHTSVNGESSVNKDKNK